MRLITMMATMLLVACDAMTPTNFDAVTNPEELDEAGPETMVAAANSEFKGRSFSLSRQNFNGNKHRVRLTVTGGEGPRINKSCEWDTADQLFECTHPRARAYKVKAARRAGLRSPAPDVTRADIKNTADCHAVSTTPLNLDDTKISRTEYLWGVVGLVWYEDVDCTEFEWVDGPIDSNNNPTRMERTNFRAFFYRPSR